VSDASLRYDFGRVGALRGLEAQLNLTNLFDQRYVATMGSNGYTASGDNQTLLTGAPRQVFLTVSTRF
jgi:iron complex outermembrane receptor protein